MGQPPFGPFLTQYQQVYTPDGEGRVGSAGGFTPSITYNAASQPTVLQTSCANGTCYPITYTYDPNTLRMTQYSAALNGGTISGTLNWNPNGSLNTLAIANPFNTADAQTCTYGADDLSRLASVNCGSTWAQTFSYDAFGNLTKSGSISWMPGYDPNTNHYLLGGTGYDADGNVMNDTFAAYTWDSDGKNLSTTYQGSGQVFSFTNDAFGHKVEASISGSYSGSFLTLGKFKLSATGQTPSYSEYPLPGGSILSQGGGLTVVQLADWLGTIRSFYSYTGGNFSGGSAHAPFGETYAIPGGYPSGFAGQAPGDGDPNNTTYYFPERELRSSQGRWLSPDPAGMAAADPSDPQSWNRYAYVLNNPLSLIDPFGLDDCEGGSSPPVGTSGFVFHTSSSIPCPDENLIGDSARQVGFVGFRRDPANIPARVAMVFLAAGAGRGCEEQLNDMVNDIQANRGSGTSGFKGLAQRWNQILTSGGYQNPGHAQAFMNDQRALNKKIENYRNSGCGDPPPQVTQWATKPLASPWPRPTSQNSSVQSWVGPAIVGTGAIACGVFVPGCLEAEGLAVAF